MGAALTTFMVGLCLGQVPPPYLTYSGELMDATGTPFDGSIMLRFELVDGTSSNPLWSEPAGLGETLTVLVVRGFFSVTLGKSEGAGLSAGVLNQPGLRLRVQVDGQWLDPPMPVQSVPYALVSEEARTLQGLQPSDLVTPAQLGDGSVGVAWGQLTGRPAGLDDGDDNTRPEVDCGGDVLTWNGASFVCVPDADTLPAMTCNASSALTWDGVQFGCVDIVALVGPDYTDAQALVAVSAAGYVTGPHFSGNYADLSGAPWTSSGADVYASGTDVGIGTASPLALLHVEATTGAPAGPAVIFTKPRDSTLARRYDFRDVGGLVGDANGASFWRGAHFAGPGITVGGDNRFPRLSIHAEYDSLTDPTLRNWVLDSSNAGPGGEHDLEFRVEGVGTALTIKANGNVGIGPVEPSAALHVSSTSLVDPSIARFENSVGGNAHVMIAGGSPWNTAEVRFLNTAAPISATNPLWRVGHGGQSGLLQLYAWDGTANRQRFEMDAGGVTFLRSINERVSVILDAAYATASNGDIVGDLWFRGRDSASNAKDYALIEGIAAGVTDGLESGALRFYAAALDGSGASIIKEYLQLNGALDAVRLFTDQVERVRVTSSGRVGIGTSAPDQLLSVNGNASKAGGGTWATFSDARLKEVTGELGTGLAEISRLQPVRYRYRSGNALGLPNENEHVGFVAQDVRKVLPEAVEESPGGYLLVNSDPILWTMLNAIKEQQLHIDAQDARIDALERRLAAMEGSLRGYDLAVPGAHAASAP